MNGGNAIRPPFVPPAGLRNYMGNQEKIDAKDESLRRFNGEPETFQTWANHLRDHMGKVCAAWKPILEWMAKTDDDLSFPQLSSQVLGPYNEPADDLAVKLEQLIVDWLPESLYNRRDQLCGGIGERHNGFLMWRRLHIDNVGGDVHINIAGIDVLREYPSCSKLGDLPSHLDGWRSLYDGYGKELWSYKLCPPDVPRNITRRAEE